jgi:Flp pilus assembly secretin CpaC
VDVTVVTVKDPTIATAKSVNGNLEVVAKSVGQTKITVGAAEKHTAIITVREGASDNGWL